MIRFFRRSRRYISIFLAVFVLLVPVILAGRAYAVAYDYNDLPHTVKVDGANDIVTVTIDPKMGRWTYWGDAYGDVNGSIVTIPDLVNVTCEYYFFQANNGLSVTDIPDDTMINATILIRYDGQSDAPLKELASLYLLYYDSGNVRQEVREGDHLALYPDYIGKPFTVSCNYKHVSGTSYFMPMVSMFGIEVTHSMTLETVSCTLTMSISSLYRQQQLTGKTNQLLTEVNQQLEANGQKLDDIVQGNQQIQDNQQQIIDQQDQMMQRPVSPAAPEGAGSVSGYDDLENQIMQDMSGGFGNASTMQQSAAQILYQYANGFTFLTWVVNGFTDVPIIHDILYVSICIGIFALLVGAISTVISGSHDSKDRGGDKK